MELNTSLNTEKLENNLRVLSSGLGNILNELLSDVGKEMSEEAKSRASGAFGNRTGKLQNSIKFILSAKESLLALTTQKSLNKSNIWYAKFVEYGANIKAKKKEYLTFKINGEWKKVKSVQRRPRPFMRPVFDEYWGGDKSKGYHALQNALMKKINEELQ